MNPCRRLAAGHHPRVLPGWTAGGQQTALDRLRHAGPGAGQPRQVIPHHTSRIHTEDKAKVVDAGWGTAFMQFLASQAILHYIGQLLKNRMHSSLSSNHPVAIHPILQIVLVQNSMRRKKLN